MAAAIPIESIATQAISMGASLVGATPAAPLRASASPRLNPANRQLFKARSVIVLALAHAEGQPELDWWDNQGGRTPGNRQLTRMSRGLANWLKKTYAAEACDLPYNAGGGGIFLKDAAVLAGLGVVGKNNLLITPQYGPRVRLRAIQLNLPIHCERALDGFAPCDTCDGPCLQACPQNAFQEGSYKRKRCQRQMRKDETHPIIRQSPVVGMPPEFRIVYCRQCEFFCPVGQ
jgi:epoxyqueuosine reductase